MEEFRTVCCLDQKDMSCLSIMVLKRPGYQKSYRSNRILRVNNRANFELATSGFVIEGCLTNELIVEMLTELVRGTHQ